MKMPPDLPTTMAESDGISYQAIEPKKILSPFIKCFWHLQNNTAEEKMATILPDGYFDIMFFSPGKKNAAIYLSGLQTKPVEYHIPSGATTFAISLKLPAAAHLPHTNIANLVNKGLHLSKDFMDIKPGCFTDIGNFALAAESYFSLHIHESADNRKKELFDILYASAGNTTVEEMAAAVHWSSRQISRYFKTSFGVSLKEYCNILRYRSSFNHIHDGHLYPRKNYYDQPHFIKEVKKYSGVTPKELAQNKDDRFIQFSTLPKK